MRRLLGAAVTGGETDRATHCVAPLRSAVQVSARHMHSAHQMQ